MQLEKQQEATLETFRSDFTRQFATERAFQAAVEACTDIASHIVAVYDLGQPEQTREDVHLLHRFREFTLKVLAADGETG